MEHIKDELFRKVIITDGIFEGRTGVYIRPSFFGSHTHVIRLDGVHFVFSFTNAEFSFIY